MYMKKFLAVLSVSAVLNPFRMQYSTGNYGFRGIGDQYCRGVVSTGREFFKGEEKNEVAFVTEELSQDDLNVLNQEHDGFYGSVTQYEIKTVKMLDRSYVTLSCDISDNYYVEEALLDGGEIPEETQSGSGT